MIRSKVLAPVLCAVVVLTGCGVLRPPPGPEVPPGCGECTSEIAQLVATIEESPGVVGVRFSRMTRTTMDRGWLSMTVGLTGKDIVSVDVEAKVDTLAEVAWRSGVDPLDALSLEVQLRNGYRESNLFYFGEDRDSYEKRWGPRPEGSEWTPVEEERNDDAEGCEVDGCREIMRDIAREVSALPGVDAVVKSVFYPDTPTSSTSADVTVLTDGTDVMDQVAEIVWRARVWPIKGIHVTADAQDGEFPDSRSYFVDPDTGQDHGRLEQLWGPRPIEE